MRLNFLSHFLRHPELVSGSISPAGSGRAARWMLKRVQHDVAGEGLVPFYRRQTQPHRQIGPMWVFAVNQVYLPWPVPVFKLFFPRNGGAHIAKQFKADKSIDGVFGGEPIRHFQAVLLHTLHQVRRYANIKRAVMLACQHIDAGLLFFSHRSSDALKWTLKQVQGDGMFYLFVPAQRHRQNQRHPELVSGSIGRLALFNRRTQVLQDQYLGAVR